VWAEEFCGRLAAARRYVVRYDQRDTGRSAAHPAGAPAYGLGDLAADAAGLLDTLGLGRAHLVGASRGGMVAQLVALDRPDRVASVTLLSTSVGPGDPDLPPAALRVRLALDDAAPATADRASVVEHH